MAKPLAFVAGFPVAHSRSPMIHRYWLELYRIDGGYDAIEVRPEAFAQFLQDLAAGRTGFIGGNVTIPHKEAAFRMADFADELATELGASNTMWMEDGRLCAMNTDGYGFAANLDQAAPGWKAGKTAAILGAGGASRAVIQTVRDSGFTTIHVVNRTLERARELADRFGDAVFAHPLPALKEVVEQADLFVNTTSLGMSGENPLPPLYLDRLAADAVVTDIVYVPLQTPVLEQASKLGLRTVDGLGMLLHQAAPGFEKWFGKRPEVTEELKAMIVKDLERQE
ncbi:shikimate dehydrogenase [Hoeflea sp. WL0058]|uniref:Shikimate dehydrogenase (NADP(+)) n=1 Tax=Flavimaribacter sediminis TaxID=2865987 RepID=A0AAE2ZKS4_9HYPH|nr:shikimate dehydrogenase [Flavimaribacter sediminis]MBW8638343.1 shikimate dehydrogenase [Flavimaribacter sediminis]